MAFLLPLKVTGQGSAPPSLPGNLSGTPALDAWIRIDATGAITVFTGKAELGQGILTALAQIAAEELDAPMASVRMVSADTGRTPNEGGTTGSVSVEGSGTAILNAAANVRMLLAEAAARRCGASLDAVTTTGEGQFRGPGGRLLSYGDLAASLSLRVNARPDASLRSPATYRKIGKALRRVDIPAKLTGGVAYVQDLRLPNMLHARVVRGPGDGTRLKPVDATSLAGMPGVVKVVRNGAFTAVVADSEWHAVQAVRRLGAGDWERPRRAPPSNIDGRESLKTLPSEDDVFFNQAGSAEGAVRRIKGRYSRPWLLHGAIGPGCAIALFDGEALTVWTSTQTIFQQHAALAQLVRLPLEKVRCIHMEGSGCYGQTGSDDAAAEAALVAITTPGRPVRMQWERGQEHGWEPMGPGMLVEMEAGIDASGQIVDWSHEVWSSTHNDRPSTAGGFLAGREVDPPFPAQIPRSGPGGPGAGQRNGVPAYRVRRGRGVHHFLPDSAVRTSAMRALGAHMNVFAIESFIDEAALSGGLDPVSFRLAHLEDPRAREVIAVCAERFGWAARRPGDGRRGCGFGFARYKNVAAYCAIAIEVEVNRETGRLRVPKVFACVDVGQAVNPDGVRNQIEGGIVQSLSWTGMEAMGFDSNGRTGLDWATYPIHRFSDVPLAMEVDVLDRPGARFLGVGEAAQGPAAAALANAIADATGARIRDMPLVPNLKRALTTNSPAAATSSGRGDRS